jgi:hypothetical protein
MRPKVFVLSDMGDSHSGAHRKPKKEHSNEYDD